jgi:hypothetical protein
VLDMPGVAAAGTGLDQAAATGGATQQWTIQPAATAGYYTITSAAANVLVTSPSTTVGDQLVVNAPNGSAAQQWWFLPVQ